MSLKAAPSLSHDFPNVSSWTLAHHRSHVVAPKHVLTEIQDSKVPFVVSVFLILTQPRFPQFTLLFRGSPCVPYQQWYHREQRAMHSVWNNVPAFSSQPRP